MNDADKANKHAALFICKIIDNMQRGCMKDEVFEDQYSRVHWADRLFGLVSCAKAMLVTPFMVYAQL